VRGFYKQFLETMTPEAAWEKALCGTRDHARELLPWNDFPADRPARLNQQADPEIEKLYKELIALRAGSPALIYGGFALLDGRKDHFCYMRGKDCTSYVVDCNLGAHTVKSSFDGPTNGFRLVFDTTKGFARTEEQALRRPDDRMAPYEARIWVK